MGLLFWLNKKPTELMPDVEKPTITLAKLIGAHMIENADKHYHESRSTGGGLVFEYIKTFFPWFEIEIRKVSSDRKADEWTVYRFKWLKESQGVVFDNQENKIIMKAWHDYYRLHKAAAEAKKEAERQQKAIDFIANTLGVGLISEGEEQCLTQTANGSSISASASEGLPLPPSIPIRKALASGKSPSVQESSSTLRKDSRATKPLSSGDLLMPVVIPTSS